MMFLRVLATSVLLLLAVQPLFCQSLSPFLECGQRDFKLSVRGRLIQDSLELVYQKQFSRRGAARDNNNKTAAPPYTLPVVVHVIHDGGTENLSTARVLRGIEFLNQSFANTDYYDQQTGVDTRIQFCLARRTPDNQPTNGITYHRSPLTDVTSSNDLAMKDLARWDPTQYINIYVVRDICTSSCGVAGYAYYPGAHGRAVDGIVMEARWLGLNEADNSVLTHEMGHSLGLYHTFEGGCSNTDCSRDGDRVCDTPPDQSTIAVPCGGAANSCTTDTDSGFATDQNDMFNNYMDYGRFSCYNALTQGQTDRMYFFIEGIRRSLLSSLGCSSPCPSVVSASFDQTPPGTSFEVGQPVTFTNTTVNGSSYRWYVNDVLQSTATDFTLTPDVPGAFRVKLVADSDSPLCLSDSVSVRLSATCNIDGTYTADNTGPGIGETVLFSANGTADTYRWTVNRTELSTADELSYSFDRPGIYEVCLTVTTGNCEATRCNFYSTQSPPTTDDCFGTSGLSLYGFEAGDRIVVGPLVPDNNGGFWQAFSLDNDLILQQLDVNGNILRIESLDVLGPDFQAIFDLDVLSDGSLLLTYGEETASARTSYLLRYDPANSTVAYRRAMTNTGYIYGLIPIPGSPDKFVAYSDLPPAETANSSNESWLFDIDGLTGTHEGSWAHQTRHGGPHTYVHGLFWRGQLKTIARFGITSLNSSFRAGVATFSAPNVLNDIKVFHRPSSTPARLYGRQIIPNGELYYTLHNGNSTGSNTQSGNWGYLSLWRNEELSWTREIRAPGVRNFAIRGGRVQDDGLYFIGQSTLQNEDITVVFSTDEEGNLRWANSYESDAGKIFAARAVNENLLSVTDNGIYVSASLLPANSGNDILAAALLRVNLDGTVEDDCVTVIPVDLSSEEVDGISEFFQINTASRTPETERLASEVSDRTYTRLTACADTCDVSTGECGLTGDQFNQVWDNGQDENARAQSILPDGTGGLIVLGVAGANVFINRLTGSGVSTGTHTLEVPTGPGITEVVTAEITEAGHLLFGGYAPSQPAGDRSAFFASFDLATDTLDWWRQLDRNAEVAGIHPVPGTEEFLLTGSRLQRTASSNINLFLQRRRLSDGALTGTLYREYIFDQMSDNLLASELVGNVVYCGTRYTGIGNATKMRAGAAWFDATTGAEILSMRSGPSLQDRARTYATDILIDGDDIYVLYRGDLNGTEVFDGSRVHLAKFTRNGAWVWGKSYDLTEYSGEHGLSLKQLDNDLIISGNGYDIPEVFAMRVAKANGSLIWAKGYRNTNGEALRISGSDGGNMVVTSTRIALATYQEDSAGKQHPQIITTNTAGDPAPGNCLEAYPLTVTLSDLDRWIEMGLTEWNAPMGDLSRIPAPGEMDFRLLTPCLDSCETAVTEEICDNGIDDDGNGFTDCEDPYLSQTCCCLDAPDLQLPPDTLACPSTTFLLRPLSVSPGVTFAWTGGTTADSLLVSSPGTYRLTVTDTCGRATSDDIVISFIDGPGPPELGSDLSVCDNGVLELSVGGDYADYLWSNFSTDTSTTFYDPGSHWVRVTDDCGNVYSDTVRITVLPTTVVDLPEEIVLCPQDSQLLTASGFATYNWYSDEVLTCEDCPEITIMAPPPGDTVMYTLLAENAAGCYSSDSLMITTRIAAGQRSAASICSGEQYDLNGTLLVTSGSYVTPAFCGGSDTLDLTVLPLPPLVERRDTICNGDSLLIFGSYRFGSGVFNDTLPAVNGCDSTIQFTLTVVDPPVTFDTLTICAGESATIFGIPRREAGTYTMDLVRPGLPCGGLASVTLEVADLPGVGISVSQENCADTTATVELSTAATTAVTWAAPDLSGTQALLTAGSYPFTLTGATGCSLDTFVEVRIANPVSVLLESVPPVCPDGDDAAIRLLPGGTATQVTIDGGQPTVTDSIGGLSAGVYRVDLLDTLGCTRTEVITIDDPTGFELRLPRDTMTFLGEEIRIVGRIFGIDETDVALEWFPADFLNCDSCLVVDSKPYENITYELSAVDSLGCARVDTIRVSVTKRTRTYVPNAFSPNGDGVNDLFTPNFGPEVEIVELLQIHERWGGLVFQRENFSPNDPDTGWDGTTLGQPLNPNVFVWLIRIRLVDGTRVSLTGDVTLLR